MRILKETEDKRRKITWLVSGGKEIHVVESKKGSSRGGHHPYDSMHFLVSGQILNRECGLEEGEESSKAIKPMESIFTDANRIHMISAIEDRVFIEIFDPPYRATDFPQYRKIVEEESK